MAVAREHRRPRTRYDLIPRSRSLGKSGKRKGGKLNRDGSSGGKPLSLVVMACTKTAKETGEAGPCRGQLNVNGSRRKERRRLSKIPLSWKKQGDNGHIRRYGGPLSKRDEKAKLECKENL